MTTETADGPEGAVAAPAGAGASPFLDDRAFDALAHRHRRELHVHCYRMLSSFEEAEDAVQETFLRAWHKREIFDEDSLIRAWLYRVATNVCLDQLRRRSRRTRSPRSPADLPWLQPYPDRLLDEIAAPDDEPDAVAVSRETIELAFLAALQVLPPRQRAVLVLRDVLGTPAAETAAILDTTVAAANSALQRARVTMQDHLPARRADWATTAPSAEERALLERFIDAHERCDADAALAIAAPDLRITMPPNPLSFEGLAVIGPLLRGAFGPDRDGDWRLVPTSGNRMPVAASYLRRPGDTEFRAFKLDVLRVRDGRIAEITTFGVAFFAAFGLPPILEDHGRDHVPTTPVTTPESLPRLGGGPRNALACIGIERLDQVVALREHEVRDLPGMTDEGVAALVAALAASGRSLRPTGPA
jgi:RNA polymerase sigma-70 factor (ECF subfamily)